MQWTHQQQAAMRSVMQGNNTLIVGKAGTGKSTMIRTLVQELKKQHRTVAVTAMTGMAASNIGGITLHSFTNIGIAELSSSNKALRQNIHDHWDTDKTKRKLQAKLIDTNAKFLYGQKVIKNRLRIQAMKDTHVLIIDEVSMMSVYLFDVIDKIMQQVRSIRGVPWGGLQLVLFGDMYQLPPVDKGPHRDIFQQFLFESPLFDNTIGTHVYVLNNVFRQKDAAFKHMLDRIARAEQNQADELSLTQRLVSMDSIPEEAVRLYATNHETQKYNQRMLDKLPGDRKPFQMTHQYEGTQERAAQNLIKFARENCIAEQTLVLKPGAFVMLLFNLDTSRGYFNGATGRVVGWNQHNEPLFVLAKDYVEGHDYMATTRGAKRAKTVVEPIPIQRHYWTVTDPALGTVTVRQIPLKLAWAMTIHKSQGLQLEKCAINIANVFQPGQAYVALSRVTTLEGLYLFGFNAKKIIASPEAKAFYDKYTKPVPDCYAYM